MSNPTTQSSRNSSTNPNPGTRLLAEIREANLTYLLLAQQMLHEDKASAMFRLGISDEIAGLIAALTPAQILRMAGSNMLLLRFRFDNRVLKEMLGGYSKDKLMASSHAAVLMAGESVDGIAA